MWQYKPAAGAALLFIILSKIAIYAGNRPDILLTVNPIPGSDLVEFRCETIVHSSLGAVVSLFEDTDSMPRWVYRMKEAKTLQRISSTEVIAYTVTRLPWPLEDRDSVLHTTISQDKNGIVRIEGIDYSEYLPPQKGMVRMRSIRSLWQFEPLPKGHLRVIFTGTGDPGGVIPLRVFNNFVHEAPYQTVKKFCQIIQTGRYQEASYPYLKEYPDGCIDNLHNNAVK